LLIFGICSYDIDKGVLSAVTWLDRNRAIKMLVGAFGEGPAVKVLRAIREEFDREAAQSPRAEPQAKTDLPGTKATPTNSSQELPAQAQPPKPEELATVTVKSSPDGADITVDEKFVGSTPSILRLTPGDHAVSVRKSGFNNWERTITVTAGGTVMVSATLEAQFVQLK
jgi:hypothetical protein